VELRERYRLWHDPAPDERLHAAQFNTQLRSQRGCNARQRAFLQLLGDSPWQQLLQARLIECVAMRSST
jgi:hypothetical protein